jgi:hypothetical protein
MPGNFTHQEKSTGAKLTTYIIFPRSSMKNVGKFLSRHQFDVT